MPARGLDAVAGQILGGPIGFEDPFDAGMFTKSSLGAPWAGSLPSESAHGVGVPMGVGIGGRVPNGLGEMFGAGCFPQAEEGVEDDELRRLEPCPSGCAHEPQSHGCGVYAPFHGKPRKTVAFTSAFEDILKIAKGDFSEIPPHDFEMCEWQLCREKGCKNNSAGGRIAGRVAAFMVNKAIDVADRFKTISPALAGAAAARRIGQSGIPIMEFFMEAAKALTEQQGSEPEPGRYVPVNTTLGMCLQCGARPRRPLGSRCWDCYMGDETPTPPWAYGIPRPHLYNGDPFAHMRPTPPWWQSMPSWDAPGAEDLLPVEQNLHKFYVGIFR